ncbi:hypothetical protein LAZ67_20000261 [Cordylochernes scorpioides]|uniref:DDB1- and CUL4-associated factor 11 n=1 Tax=Cordylochernes scorpioides TaxID=51811 RepID=A0ABY6LLB0_9ARAC|nr:hypothetical protein LAZ67_20000261 [Cordylochernes scorpioides]
MGDSDSDSEPDITTILQYLIRRIQTAVTLWWFVPADVYPDTSVLDNNDLSLVLRTKLNRPNQLKILSLLKQLHPQHQQYQGGLQEQSVLQHLCQRRRSPHHSMPSCVLCVSHPLAAAADYHIRIYNTQSDSYVQLKKVKARDVGWSILDTAISPDGYNFVYCSWSESVHVCNIYGEHDTHHALPLHPDDRRFCIFSLNYSQDGREIVGGANDECLYIYDMQVDLRTTKIRCHDNDVNSVAFADLNSQILFSCGDDSLCKVWDRRVLSEENPKPVGLLAGHLDGITYVDSKGDGRYLITNSKDQTIKLWDIRAFSPSNLVEGVSQSPPTWLVAQVEKRAMASSNWDYRWQSVPRKFCQGVKNKLPGDTSLMTYRGHSVLQTLIRCRFSPAHTTAQCYIYSGCGAGKFVVYDVLTGKIVFSPSAHSACVRDVDWHPYRPEMVTASVSSSNISLYISSYKDHLCNQNRLKNYAQYPFTVSSI